VQIGEGELERRREGEEKKKKKKRKRKRKEDGPGGMYKWACRYVCRIRVMLFRSKKCVFCSQKGWLTQPGLTILLIKKKF
jgi:hypothetical protein